ncbi:MAG TPA: EamA family transporter [Gemmatimonadaceae bacterium]|nr:EamA family transporter [Gemmatimonadaceae bacterium]
MPYILLAATLWGLLGPVAYVALREGVSPLEIAFWRAALASVLYAAHAAVRGSWRIERRDVPAVVAFGAVGVSVFYGSYMLAVERGGAALAAVLLYTAPAWVALLARIFLGERLGARKLVALAATLAGVVLVATAGGGALRVDTAGIVWGLVAGWSYATYYLFGRRYFARYDAAGVLALALPVGALGLLPFVDFAAKSTAAWGALLFLAVVPTYAAYLLYAAGLRRVEATRAATVATIEPVVAAVAAYVAFGERLSPMGYVGAAVVLGGVLLVVSERTRV